MKYFFLLSMIFSISCFSCGSSSSSSNSQSQDPHATMHHEIRSELIHEKEQNKLNGKWLIIQVYDMPIDSMQFDGKQPLMIIDVSKGILSGNDGCNLFHGKLSFKNDKIVFGPAAGTLMACNHLEISGKILKSFNEKELSFTLKELLIFSDGDQQVMALKRQE